MRDTTADTEEGDGIVSRETGSISTDSELTLVPQQKTSDIAVTRSETAELQRQEQN